MAPRTSWLTRRRLVAGAILAAGWTAAAVLHATATPVEEDPQLLEMQHSKSYRRQLEVIGGKASLLAADLEEWFTGLWRGRNLAVTTAALTAAAALVYLRWSQAAPPRDGAAR